MATRRIIKSVLANFLGTYVSRRSDYEGYLLFGFLVDGLVELRINLLVQGVSDRATPKGAAVLSAVAKFADQRQKAGIPASQCREALLTIRKLPGLVWGSVNRQRCAGFNIRFLAAAMMDDGKSYECERIAFIAPQKTIVELRNGVGK